MQCLSDIHTTSARIRELLALIAIHRRDDPVQHQHSTETEPKEESKVESKEDDVGLLEAALESVHFDAAQQADPTSTSMAGDMVDEHDELAAVARELRGLGIDVLFDTK